MITVENLTRNYGDFKAVEAVSFEVKPGEVVGLLGHNGAGKTTIMKMLTGFLEPSAGTLTVNGFQHGLDTPRIQQGMGYLPENCPVWPEMTVIAYLEFQAQMQGMASEAVPAAVAQAIAQTALKEKATEPIQTLSRGYRQRVGVAQAILHSPGIVILDEPTNGLDPSQIFQMRELIRKLAQSATVILSTHILQEVQAVCERVLILREGRLAVDASIASLQEERALRVTLDQADAADSLGRVEGVAKAVVVETEGALTHYRLDAEAAAAPAIAAAVAAAGQRLYALTPETRNLETVFAAVSEGQKFINQD